MNSRSTPLQAQFLEAFKFGGNATGTLTVKVIEGKDLVVKDRRNSSSDPYAWVGFYAASTWIDRDKKQKNLNKKTAKKTKVIKKTINPQWNEDLSFEITPEILGKKAGLRVQIYDWDKISSDDFMGECHFQWDDIAAVVDYLSVAADKPDFTAARQKTVTLVPRPKQEDPVTGTVTFQFAFNNKK